MAIESGEGDRVEGVPYDHGGVSGTYYAGSNLLENVVFTQVPWGGHAAGAKRTEAIGIAACKFDHVGQLIFGECKLTATHRYTGGLRLGQFHGFGTEYDGDTEYDGPLHKTRSMMVYKGHFEGGRQRGCGVEFVNGRFTVGGLYEDDELLDAGTPIARRGFSADVVRQLKEIYPHDTQWEQVDDEQEDGDDEQEDDRNEMHNSDRDLASPEPADQRMEPSRAHECGRPSGQCNGKRAAGAQEEEAARSKKKKPRKQRTGAAGRAKQKAVKAVAGFKKQSRASFEKEHGKGSIVSGKRRDCLIVAAWHITPDTLREQGVTRAMLRKLMPGDGRTQDTAFSALQAFYREYNYGLNCVTADYAVAGGPALSLLKKTAGRFLVQLRLAVSDHDTNPAWHCVAYNADIQKVIDNDATSRCLEASDTSSKKKAHEAFKSFVEEGLIVRVTNIYELVAADSDCSPPPPKQPRAV
jgi:hypothetical protein